MPIKIWEIYKKYQSSAKSRVLVIGLSCVIYIVVVSLIDYMLPQWNYAVTQFIYNLLSPFPLLATFTIGVSLLGSVILSKPFWLRCLFTLFLLVYLPLFPVLVFMHIINIRNHTYPNVIKAEALNARTGYKALVYGHGVSEYEGEYYYYGGCSLVIQHNLRLPKTILVDPSFSDGSHYDELYERKYDEQGFLIEEPNNCNMLPQWLSNKKVRLGKRTLSIEQPQEMSTWVPHEKFQYSYQEFLLNEISTPVLGALFLWYTLLAGTKWSFGR